jgi:tetratricopeptide (TPR) repeat protein
VKKSGAFVQFLLIPVFLLGVASLFAASEQDKRLASELFERARTLYSEGKSDVASRILASALEFFPDSSEALYLSALIDLSSQETTAMGIEKLREALKSASWSKTDPDTARQSLAEALIRTGRYAEAISILTSLTAAKPEISRAAYLLADAYLESGKYGEAEKAIANSLRFFPKYEGLYLLSARLFTLRGNAEAARQAVKTGLREMPDSLALRLKQAGLEADPASRIRDVDEYTAKGGSDPQAAVIALEAGVEQPEKYITIFLSNKGLSRLDLTRRVSAVAAKTVGIARSFQTALSEYTGNRDLDLAGDGFYEERWEYVDGAPRRWVRDRNRDGIPEYVAGFSDGRARTLTLPKGNSSLTIAYEEYPFIYSVTMTDKTGKKEFTLAPRTLGCFLLDAPALATPEALEAAASFHVPTESEIIEAAVGEEDFRPNASTADRRIGLDRGKRTYMEEDAGGHGVIDHKVWYEDGLPVKGLRDLRGDGAWQETDTYRSGKLWKSVVDTDGDGKPDYAELRDGGLIKLWDYNEDGIDDARERAGAGGTVVREFSTALNGRYDLEIVFKNGRITAVSRGGKPVAVTPDEKSGVTWIGGRGSFPVDAAEKDGIASFGGRPYLFFRFMGNLYVEVLE